jgi:tripartite-type tricarboxylate transporter receptor subunit TctC
MAGVDLLPVPYKGTPATFADVINGSLDATLTDPGNALGQVKGGYLRALGVTSPKRNPVTPDWPAISETLQGFDFTAWNALVGPAGMPRELVDRLSSAVNQALKEKGVVDRLAANGTIPFVMTPDELKKFIDAETAKWVRLAREANIQPE